MDAALRCIALRKDAEGSFNVYILIIDRVHLLY